MAVSQDGKWLACGNDIGEVLLWDVVNWIPAVRYRAHQGFVHGLAFSPDGKRLATAGSDQQIHLWETGTTNMLFTLRGHQSEIWSLEFSRDGHQLVSVSRDGTARLWKTEIASSQSRTFTVPFGSFMNGSSPDGSTWITSDFRARAFQSWSLPEGRLLRTLAWKECDPQGKGLRDVFQVPGNEVLGGVTIDGIIHILNPTAGVLERSVQLPETNFSLWSLSPDKQWVLGMLADEKTGVLFDLRAARQVQYLRDFFPANSFTAFSPDNRLLAYATTNYLVKLWDLEARREKATLKGHNWYVEALGFSPNGKLLASGARDGDLWLWSVDTGKPLFGGPLKGNMSAPLSLAFSSDSRTLASYGFDRTLRWWSTSTGQELLMFPSVPLWFASPFDSPAPWHPGGRFLLWYDQPGQARITMLPSLAEVEAAESQQAKARQFH
jgi:WD40 repeat protein